MGWHSITNGLGVPTGVIKHGLREFGSSYSISPRMSEKLKQLHLFGFNQVIINGFNQMIIKMWHSITNWLGVPTGVIKHGHWQFAFFFYLPSYLYKLKIETITPFWF